MRVIFEIINSEGLIFISISLGCVELLKSASRDGRAGFVLERRDLSRGMVLGAGVCRKRHNSAVFSTRLLGTAREVNPEPPVFIGF